MWTDSQKRPEMDSVLPANPDACSNAPPTLPPPRRRTVQPLLLSPKRPLQVQHLGDDGAPGMGERKSAPQYRHRGCEEVGYGDAIAADEEWSSGAGREFPWYVDGSALLTRWRASGREVSRGRCGAARYLVHPDDGSEPHASAGVTTIGLRQLVDHLRQR